ncbi:MAG TPA: hypothetical protein VGM29_19730, partial [Polyangiaceae bacterium]
SESPSTAIWIASPAPASDWLATAACGGALDATLGGATPGSATAGGVAAKALAGLALCGD